MSLGLDDRARRAAENLKASVDQAPLLLAAQNNTPTRRRVAGFWPVWIAAVLILGSAVGFALVVQPTVVEPTSPTTTTESRVFAPGPDLAPPSSLTTPQGRKETYEFVFLPGI